MSDIKIEIPGNTDRRVNVIIKSTTHEIEQAINDLNDILMGLPNKVIFKHFYDGYAIFIEVENVDESS